MARSQETFSKKEKEKKRLKKRQDKLLKKEERKANSPGGDFDSMIAYVDENGRIVDTPPDLSKKKKVDADSIELGVPKREEIEMDSVLQGKIAYFNDQKGYGFIKDLTTEDKYFVHINNMLDDLSENDLVTFELEKGPKGLSAIKVKKFVKQAITTPSAAAPVDNETDSENNDTESVDTAPTEE